MQIKSENKIEEIQEEQKSKQDIHRVVISKEANEALMKMLLKVNDGFVAGEITRTDIVNWLLQKSKDSVSESDVQELRSLHFDEAKALIDISRRFQSAAELPDHIKRAVRDYCGVSQTSSKRTLGAKLKTVPPKTAAS